MQQSRRLVAHGNSREPWLRVVPSAGTNGSLMTSLIGFVYGTVLVFLIRTIRAAAGRPAAMHWSLMKGSLLRRQFGSTFKLRWVCCKSFCEFQIYRWNLINVMFARLIGCKSSVICVDIVENLHIKTILRTFLKIELAFLVHKFRYYTIV